MSMDLDVKIFLDACDQKPSVENTLLYKDLIVEEFTEFIEAFNMEDDVEQLDACMDMIWVILGYCHMKKFDIKSGWDEVARSNLCKIDSKTGKVTRREDGKILKPEGWKPPDLTKFV
jgi:NTP pyrophosphatase (non-canonical NTP hydrolase)